MTFLQATMFYMVGMFSAIFVTKVIKYYHHLQFVHDINTRILKLLRDVGSHESWAWKNEMINRVIHSYPEDVRKSLRFTNWAEAMIWLKNEERKGLRK